MTIPEGQSRTYESQGKRSKLGRFNFEQLENAYDHSPMGVLAIDKKHIITYANHAALAYSGLEQNKVLGQSLTIFTLMFHMTNQITPN